MDRINIKCLLSDHEIQLQLDKKAMPGETGPCYMITADGCFKGYISRQRNGRYEFLGTAYYTNDELIIIGDCLRQSK